MTDQLSLYNGALLICGERFLGSLTEEREPRRLLDNVWSRNGVKTCLEHAQWFFATRSVQLDYDPAVQPPFGYNRAFDKPTDWLKTVAVCSDEFFRTPLLRYVDEAGMWYSDLDTIYVRYVSNDIGYGMNYALWTESFREYVEHFFASKIILKLSNSEEEEKKIHELMKKALLVAKNDSAMTEPTSFPAQGNWSKSRSRYPTRRDGGNTSGSLIG